MNARAFDRAATDRCPRPRIAQKVALAARRRIVLVHGPAGCGKSVSLQQHLATTIGPTALYAVRAEHAHVSAFARGLTQSLIAAAPAAHRLLPAVFAGSRRQARPWDAVALWLAQHLARPVTIAIDQLHRIEESDDCFRFLVRAIDATGPHVRWMLATRSTAMFPLPRWLAAGDADASLDEATFRLEALEVSSLARVLHVDAGSVEASRVRHDGAIGAIVDEAFDVEAAWSPFFERADDLVALAALPNLDGDVVAQLPPGSLELVRDVERAVPLAVIRADGSNIGAFSQAARTHLYERLDAGSLGRGRKLAARALESAGQGIAALQLFLAADALDDVTRMLDGVGFDLYESGGGDVVAAAIAKLPIALRLRSAIALTLEGTDESCRGRYDIAESWFEHALRAAPDDQQRLRVDIAYAVELLRRGRADAYERLSELARVATDNAHAVAILASLATAHASAERIDDAKRCIAEAIAALDTVDDVTIRATVYQRAAFVALTAGQSDEAAAFAESAASLANEHGNDELVAVARSVSYVVALSFHDDQATASLALEEISRAGIRVGNGLFRRFALIGKYLIFTERGDRETVRALDRELLDEELDASRQHTEEGILPARAMHLAWAGDFDAAYRSLVASAERQTSPEMRALRWAEIATYGAAAGRTADASLALKSARAGLRAILGNGTVEGVKIGLLLALASLILRRRRSAGVLLSAVSADIERWPRWRPLHAFLHAVASAGTEGADAQALLVSLDTLHDRGLGGWARMIETIPARSLAFRVRPT